MKKPELTSPLPGPLTRALVERDAAVMSPSYTRSYPFAMAKGRGCWVWDVDGNRYLDFNAGIAVCATGHSHPKVVRAIRDQTNRFLHYSGTDFYYEVEVLLAERLAKLSPTGQPAKIFFSNSGTEAIESAIKLARHCTGRPNLIAFHGAFHGRTMGSLSLTFSKPIQRQGFGPYLPGVVHVPYPNCFRCPLNARPDRCGKACLDYLEQQVLGHDVDPTEVAAIIVEPIQGEGGYLVPPQGFFHGLREICDRHGILLVVDEVQTGMGRTGRMFAVEHEGVHPDIVAIAKGIASGLPLGAIIAPSRIMAWPAGAHGSTFGGNPVSCAAALATLDLLENGLVANAERMGTHLSHGLRRLARTHGQIGDVRGRGLMWALDFVTEPGGTSPNAALRDAVVEACFQRGLLVLGAGVSALRLCPPLIVRRSEVVLALQILGDALSAVTKVDCPTPPAVDIKTLVTRQLTSA